MHDLQFPYEQFTTFLHTKKADIAARGRDDIFTQNAAIDTLDIKPTETRTRANKWLMDMECQL